MREFISVTDVASLPPGHGRTVHVRGRELAVFNLNGEFFAIDNTCPHKGGPLGAGLLKDGRIFCPLHGWEFEVQTGVCITRPDRPVKRYPTQVRDGQVQICLETKSTVQQIRQRFDQDVERFSHLEAGNTAQVDSVLSLELIAEAAAAANPTAQALLDAGCGAGNYSLKVLERLPGLNVTLLDVSQPMLERAKERVSAVTAGIVCAIQADLRQAELGVAQFDIIVAAAVLHHLRTDEEWREVFVKLHQALKSGGTLWIYDLVEHALPEIQGRMWERYGGYLTAIKDESYRDHVFDYIEREDTPKSLTFQLDLLRAVGFSEVEVLHKNTCFAAFGARK